MRKFLWLIILIPSWTLAQIKKTSPTATNTKLGHSIQITMKPYQNIKLYIGTNYGKNKVLADSCLLNEKSEGVFESKQKLTPGIYFVISPKYSILSFDIILFSLYDISNCFNVAVNDICFIHGIFNICTNDFVLLAIVIFVVVK